MINFSNLLSLKLALKKSQEKKTTNLFPLSYPFSLQQIIQTQVLLHNTSMFLSYILHHILVIAPLKKKKYGISIQHPLP